MVSFIALFFVRCSSSASFSPPLKPRMSLIGTFTCRLGFGGREDSSIGGTESRLKFGCRLAGEVEV